MSKFFPLSVLPSALVGRSIATLALIKKLLYINKFKEAESSLPGWILAIALTVNATTLKKIQLLKFRVRACFQTDPSDPDPPKSPLRRGTLSFFLPPF
jgi:hypothetical protein